MPQERVNITGVTIDGLYRSLIISQHYNIGNYRLCPYQETVLIERFIHNQININISHWAALLQIFINIPYPQNILLIKIINNLGSY